MRIGLLVKELEYEVLAGNVDTEVSTLVYDSRKVEKGSVFVCISGRVCDRVFIYNRDGGFRDNYTLPESKYKTGIYHKKNTDKECIDYIDAYHKMGEYKILITSCWFGVGHDLKDTDRCCVIICGNIPIHEEIQCVGRFRNAESIQCVIVTNEYNRHDNIYKSGLELEQIRGRLSDNNNYNSYIVGSTNIHVQDMDDVWYAWYLYKYGCMFNNIYRKIEAYNKLGWTVFKPMFNIDKELCDKMMACDCKLKKVFGIYYEQDQNKFDSIIILGRNDEYKKNHKNHKKGDIKYTNYACIKTNSDNNVDIYKNYNIGKKFDKYKADELDNKKELMKNYVLKRLYNNEWILIGNTLMMNALKLMIGQRLHLACTNIMSQCLIIIMKTT